MKFGIPLYPHSRFADLAALVRFVRQAERLGYDFVSIPEHTAFPSERERVIGRTWWDPIVLAAHLADATRTIRFNFGVLVLPIHHPVQFAKQIATLDCISGGRIGIGVGLGSSKEELMLGGADPHKRGVMTEEHIGVMKALWTGEPSDYNGKYFSFSDISCYPKPYQKPHPPIYIGGAPMISARRAAIIGDGWMPKTAAFEEFEKGLQIVKETLRERRRSLEEFDIFRQLPLFERNEEGKEHIRSAGASEDPCLDGDPARAIEYVRRCEAAHVTLMKVDMPGDLQRMTKESKVFAEKVIHRL